MLIVFEIEGVEYELLSPKDLVILGGAPPSLKIGE